MMNIIEKSRELTEVEEYLLTASPAIEVIKDLDDNTVITVDAFCIFEDNKDNGDTVELLSALVELNVLILLWLVPICVTNVDVIPELIAAICAAVNEVSFIIY